MKLFYHQHNMENTLIEEDLHVPSLQEDIKKTRLALEIAQAGFDQALDNDMIDSYIYEINALQKRYQHLLHLAGTRTVRSLSTETPVTARVSSVFG
jgi:hypothetical protein